MIAAVPANSLLSQLKNKARVFRNTLRNSLPPIDVDNRSHLEDSNLNSRKRSYSDSLSSVAREREQPRTKKLKKSISVPHIAAVDTQNVKDVKLQPSFKKSRKEFKELKENREDENKRTMFLGNYPLAIRETELRKLCVAFGEVDSIRFRNIFGSKGSMSKGVAARRKEYSDAITHCCVFVVFKEQKAAADAVKHFKGMKLGNRHLNSSLASDKHGCLSKMSVFVANLPKDTDEEELRLYFRQFGPIVIVKLIRDTKTGDCKGMGYVEFQTDEGLMLCLKAENHFFRNKKIKVTKCFKKDKSKGTKSAATFYSQELSSSASKKKANSVSKKKEQYVKTKGKKSSDKRASNKPGKKHHKSSLI